MPEDIQREIFEADVLIVGGGPAGVSAAIRLADKVKEHNEAIAAGKKEGKKLDELTIVLVEKGEGIGSHSISGAVMDPIAIKELMPDWLEQGAPVEGEVKEEEILYITKKGKSFKLPIVPPPFRNHGNYIISLGKMMKWMGEKLETREIINVFPGFPGVELLLNGTKVIGVRTGDRGLDKEGHPKSNFEAGYDIHAKVTIFAEGTRGHLYRSLMEKLGLDKGKNPQIYAQGVKEVWEVPAGRIKGGKVTHTMGFPLKKDHFGGTFIYEMQNNLLVVGLVVGLNSPDPFLDPHQLLQDFKQLPKIKALLEGGKMVSYGGKTIPEGGYFSIPKLAFDGGMICGDSAGFVNVPRLKGVHYSIKSGILAADAAFEALLKEDYSEATLKKYADDVENSYIGKDLYRVRNFRQPFDRGLIYGSIIAGLIEATNGKLPAKKLPAHNDGYATRKVNDYYGTQAAQPREKKFDGKLTFDRLTGAYASGTMHDEHSPCHLLVLEPDICSTRCAEEYKNPCQHFCPTQVYEMVDDDAKPGKQKLQINFTNCVHCKTCDIKDPYQIIRWVPPEGGGGPRYVNM